MTRRVFLLQGLAQNPEDWSKVLQHLPPDIAAEPVDALQLGFGPDQELSLEQAAAELEERIDGGDDVVIVGLSYGAVIAARHAIDHPRPHRKYLLAGGQIKPRRWPGPLLLRAHPAARIFMQLRTRRRLDPHKVRSIMRMYASLDLRPKLHRITSRVTFAVGTIDRPHRKPARDVVQRVPHSEVVELTLTEHEPNKTGPHQLAAHIERLARS
ncbi:alpha/beta fold hydrolase [Nesterenkonia populi]|uniref:alpha/beta fold hydrolase n=1 Tax=Nesterenkonia populi TaxID=1591087 RepID=UPI0011BED39D|nr:alpha/beta hydrolase [Nesterenkonia populi]